MCGDRMGTVVRYEIKMIYVSIFRYGIKIYSDCLGRTKLTAST